MSDPYVILGIPRNASEEEIKKSYRALVKKYHPDLHPGDRKAAEKMSEINAAYDMLKSGKDSAGRPVEDPSEKNYDHLSGLDIAEALMRAGDFAGAGKILDGACTRSARWYYLSAVKEYASGNFTAAEIFIRRAVELEPFNINYRQAFGSISGAARYYSAEAPVSGGISARLLSRILAAVMALQLIYMLLLGAGFFYLY